jgi:hypothetical protein
MLSDSCVDGVNKVVWAATGEADTLNSNSVTNQIFVLVLNEQDKDKLVKSVIYTY